MSSIAAVSMTSALDAAKDLHAASSGAQLSGSNPVAAARDDFSPHLAARPTATPAAFQPALHRGILGNGNALGDQVLNGLEKLGRSMEKFNAMGSAPTRPASAVMTVPSDPKATSQAGAKADPLGTLQDMWQDGIQQQKQLYATVFEFELVEESSESMMKSLKSLLTQGGG